MGAYEDYKIIVDTSGRKLIEGRDKILNDMSALQKALDKQRAKDAKKRNEENKKIQDDFQKTLKNVTGDDLEDSQANVDALNADQGIKAGFYGTIKDAVTEENQALTDLNNKYPNASESEKQGWYDDANIRLGDLTELTAFIKLINDDANAAHEEGARLLDNLGMQKILTGINTGGDVKLIKTSSGYVIQAGENGEFTFTARQLKEKLSQGGTFFNRSKELNQNPKAGTAGYAVFTFLRENIQKKGTASEVEGFTTKNADGSVTYNRDFIKQFMLGEGPRGVDLLEEFNNDRTAAQYWATLFDPDGTDPYIDPKTHKGDPEKLKKLKSKVVDEYMKKYAFLAEEQTAAVEDELDDDVVDVNLDDDKDKNIGPDVIPTVEVEGTGNFEETRDLADAVIDGSSPLQSLDIVPVNEAEEGKYYYDNNPKSKTYNEHLLFKNGKYELVED